MNKPEKQTLSYYDYNSVEKYLITNKIWTEKEASDFWVYLCEDRGIKNGMPFCLSDWALKHDNGKFAYMIPEEQHTAIKKLLKHFDGPDQDQDQDGVVWSATFSATW
jgi:hypothetical protein